MAAQRRATVLKSACCRGKRAIISDTNSECPAGKRNKPSPANGAAGQLLTPSRKKTDLGKSSQFDKLPDDLLIEILSRVYARASSPADVANVILTCRRFLALGMEPQALAGASQGAIAVSARSWCSSSHNFLQMCTIAGNVDALFFLGVIHFYCLEERWVGASLLAKAALKGHGGAMYALAAIHFNGSGGKKEDRNAEAGVALCARAAHLGNTTALRELGHCHQDGYGAARNIQEGRRFLMQANMRDIMEYVAEADPAKSPGSCTWLQRAMLRSAMPTLAVSAVDCDCRSRLASAPQPTGVVALGGGRGPEGQQGPLQRSRDVYAAAARQPFDEVAMQEGLVGGARPLHRLKLMSAQQATCPHGLTRSHSNCAGPLRQVCLVLHVAPPQPELFDVPSPPPHCAHRFLVEWYKVRPLQGGLQVCENPVCGRPETRMHEFRCCMLCSKAKYCSRTCQVADWKLRHRFLCGTHTQANPAEAAGPQVAGAGAEALEAAQILE